MGFLVGAPDESIVNQMSGRHRSGFTPKQGQYLAFIDACTRANRRPPADAEIQRHFGFEVDLLASVSAAPPAEAGLRLGDDAALLVELRLVDLAAGEAFLEDFHSGRTRAPCLVRLGIPAAAPAPTKHGRPHRFQEGLSAAWSPSALPRSRCADHLRCQSTRRGRASFLH